MKTAVLQFVGAIDKVEVCRTGYSIAACAIVILFFTHIYRLN